MWGNITKQTVHRLLPKKPMSVSEAKTLTEDVCTVLFLRYRFRASSSPLGLHLRLRGLELEAGETSHLLTDGAGEWGLASRFWCIT